MVQSKSSSFTSVNYNWYWLVAESNWIYRDLGSDSSTHILSAVDEIEDNLYYFSDVISAGIPDVGKLITDNILKLLIFPSILPSLRMVSSLFYKS